MMAQLLKFFGHFSLKNAILTMKVRQKRSIIVKGKLSARIGPVNHHGFTAMTTTGFMGKATGPRACGAAGCRL